MGKVKFESSIGKNCGFCDKIVEVDSDQFIYDGVCEEQLHVCVVCMKKFYPHIKPLKEKGE